MTRRARRSSYQESSGRILVQPMNELGPPGVPRQSVKKPVKVLVSLRTTLRSEPRRLVQHERARVLVDNHVADELFFVLRQQPPPGLRPAWTGGRTLQRRHSDLLSGLDPVARHRAFARQPQLPGSSPARDGVETHVRQMPLEPTIKTNAVVVVADGEGANVAHGARLAKATARVLPNNQRRAFGSFGSAGTPWDPPKAPCRSASLNRRPTSPAPASRRTAAPPAPQAQALR